MTPAIVTDERCKVHFADGAGAVSGSFQFTRKGTQMMRDRAVICPATVLAGIESREQRISGGRAYRICAEAIRVAHTSLGKNINIRGLYIIVAVAAEAFKTVLVCVNQEDIGFVHMSLSLDYQL